MSTEVGLLAAIWDSPHDDLPRLVYADFLEETCDPVSAARAEFIRVQCELARLDEYDERWDKLHKRERALWKQHAAAWRKRLPAKLREAEFGRGFVVPEERKLKISAFLKLTPESTAAAPTWSCKIDDSTRDAEPVAANDALLRFDSVKFWTGITGSGAERVLASEKLRNVASLSLGSTDEWLKGLSALADNPSVCHLSSLDVYSGLNDDHIKILGTGAAFATLRTLSAYSHTISATGITSLFQSRSLVNLRHLTLPCWYGDEGAKAIAKSKPAFRLRTLSMYGNCMSDEGVSMLANWSGMSSVRKLHISSNSHIVGPEALASSPFTTELRELDLRLSKLDRAGAMALARSKSLERLLRLHIQGTPAATDPVAVQALVKRFGQDAVSLRYPGQRKTRGM